MKLLVRPKPEKGESFIGYLVRLTEVNAYDTPSWILSLSDIDYMELQWTFSFLFGKLKKLDKLAHLSENELSDLNALIYVPTKLPQGNTTEHEYDFYGASLNRSIIRPHSPKVCPKCLAEFGYCFRIWDCSLVTACPVHSCIFFDACPKCNRRIRCIRNSLAMCDCGCDWRTTEGVNVCERELQVSRRVYKLCGIMPSQDGKPNGKNPLRALNLRDFVVVLTFVAGGERKISWATGRPSKSIKLRNAELHKIFAKAHAAFENWPHNFHQFLSKQSRGEIRLNPCYGKLDTALKREFGSFYDCLYQDLVGRQFDFMREAFTQFLNVRLHSQCQSPTRNSSAHKVRDSDKYLSVTDARRSLKITSKAVFDLMAGGEIRGAITNGSQGPELGLNAIDIERLRIEFDQSITPRDLAKRLGVDCETVRELARKGLLQARSRRSIDGYNTLRFGRGAAEEFLRTTTSAKVDSAIEVASQTL